MGKGRVEAVLRGAGETGGKVAAPPCRTKQARVGVPQPSGQVSSSTKRRAGGDASRCVLAGLDRRSIFSSITAHMLMHLLWY